MAFWLMPPIAVISTAICLYLWFRDVRRIMTKQKSTMESAKAQFKIFRAKARKVGNAPHVAVMERSESIYQQAVEHYNRTHHKPWVYLPVTLMGVHTIRKGGEHSGFITVRVAAFCFGE